MSTAKDLEARMRRLQWIAEFGRRALTAMDMPSLLRDGVELARSELDVSRCDLLAFSPEGAARLLAACNEAESSFHETAVNVPPESPAWQVLRTQEPVIIESLQGNMSSLNVPLFGHGRPRGVLGAHALPGRSFLSEEIDFLQAIAHLLSAALQRSTQEELRRQRHMLRAEQMMAIGQVAAGVAHELRNPLTSIKGLIQVNLRECSARGLPTDDLAVIDHEIRRMERTLQTFLDFARPPQPNRRPLDLANVVNRVFALVSGRAHKQHVALQTKHETPITVDADEDQLQQLLLNLILNSLDAMPGGGTIEVDVCPPRDGYVEVVVRDSGPGIPAHILPKLFETFVSGKETGVGLGLPLSQRIAEDHGGTLTASNLAGGGACFSLRLPVR